MPVNHYFNHFSAIKTSEQRLYEDLLVESIRIHGHNIYYLPREDWDETDTLFGENVQSKFSRAYIMEMYIANVDGWQGDGDFFSKFGLEIRDNSSFVVSKRTFERYMPSTIARRPREGDLLYVPVMQKIFEIKFVEEELLFFSKGNKTPYIYELRTEAFRYANEKLDTGVEVIDDIDTQSSYTIEISLSGEGNYIIGETVTSGAVSGVVGNWDSISKKLYLYDIVGQFTTGNVIGMQSNTDMAIANTDTLGDFTYYDLSDNKLIDDEANTILDRTESNPFGYV